MWRHACLLSLSAALAASQTPTASPQTPQHAHALTSSPVTAAAGPVSASLTPVASTQTCENLSINYVTHRLPQQCLGRTSSPYTRPSGSDTTSNTSSADPATESASSSKPNLTNNDADTSTSSTIISINETPMTVQATPLSVPTDGTQPAESEEESLLDNAKFLSFEDWKKQNIAQKGIPDSNKASSTGSRERKRPGINNALEGLGEDAEIEIDFGFGSHEPLNHASVAEKTAVPEPGAAEDSKDKPNQKRSKDAGKTCKERFNYASFDCAANVLKTNPKCKSASSVLVENKDSYMLNECSQDNKFVIVELCESVLIDTLVLANFEFFSSMFRNFRVSVSDRYPVKPDKWIDLGTFEARNSRDIQPFLIETSPDTFARYLRIEFLSHYGSEYYCPLSLIRVHGITMFEQYRMSISTDNDDPEEEEAPVAEAGHELSVPGSTAVKEVKADSDKAVVPDSADAKIQADEPAPVHAEEQQPVDATSKETPTENTASVTDKQGSASRTSVCPAESSTEDAITATGSQTCLSAPVTAGPKPLNETSSPVTTSSEPSAAPKAEQPVTAAESASQSKAANATDTTSSSTKSGSSSAEGKPTTKSLQAVNVTSVVTSTAVVSNSSRVHSPSSSSPPVVTPATPSVPATQESFFKSVHNRLSLLEANSTLSLQYIESQSQLLREAFSKVEKRNAATTSKFLDMLNSTVLAELARYKGEYEQIWQSTVLELASQRDEGRRERELLGERVRLLAEEMVAQKRLMAAQATLLLLCLSIVVFAKFGTAGVDSSLVQGVQELVSMRRGRRREASQGGGGIGKHQHQQQQHNHHGHHHGQPGSLSLGRRWPWESPWTSPPRSRDITRPQTATGLADGEGKVGQQEIEDSSDSAGEAVGAKRRLELPRGSTSSDTDDGGGGPGRSPLANHVASHVLSDGDGIGDEEAAQADLTGSDHVRSDPHDDRAPIGLGLSVDDIETTSKPSLRRDDLHKQIATSSSRSAPATPRLGVGSEQAANSGRLHQQQPPKGSDSPLGRRHG